MNLSINLKSLSPAQLARMLGHSIRRFHFIIFFTVVAAGFAVGVIFLNQSLNDIREDKTYVSEITAGSIDSETLQQVSNLQLSSEVKSLPELPTGSRTNPFGE